MDDRIAEARGVALPVVAADRVPITSCDPESSLDDICQKWLPLRVYGVCGIVQMMPYVVSCKNEGNRKLRALGLNSEVSMVAHTWRKLCGGCSIAAGNRLSAAIRALLSVWLLSVAIIGFALPSHALPELGWTQVNVGSGIDPGSYSYTGSPTYKYTIGGDGAGASSGSSDSTNYRYGVTTGNIEMIGKLSNQAGASAYATAGFMMRDSLDPTAAQASIWVSPSNGVTFTCRQANGGNAVTTLGPTVATPVWLRLVRSGTTAAGYYSTDGLSWTLVGSSQITLSAFYDIGFAVNSGQLTGPPSTVDFTNVSYMTPIPQRTNDMLLWTRSDVGLIAPSNNVSQWTDQSTLANSGTQSDVNSKPLAVTSAGAVPVVNFNPSGSYKPYLGLGTGFKTFTSGATFILLVKPSVATNLARFFQFANSSGGPNNDVWVGESVSGSNINVTFHVRNGTSDSNTTTTSGTGVLSTSRYKVLEVVHSGAGTATIYVDGQQQATTGNPSNINNVLRQLNFIGKDAGPGIANLYKGDIAEFLVFNYAMTAEQRAPIENYLYMKYLDTDILTSPTPPKIVAPIISPTNSIATGSQTVTIATDSGALTYYTTNGQDPLTYGVLYTQPFTLSTSGTYAIKAVSKQYNRPNSDITTATVQVDPDASRILVPGLVAWYRADNGAIIASGSSVGTWKDMSPQHLYDATQATGSSQPTFNATGANGKPSLTFDGTADNFGLPSGFADFTQGASFFIVTKPATLTSGKRFFELSTGGSSNQIYMQEFGGTGTGGGFYYASGGSTRKVEVSSGALTSGVVQLFEATLDTAGAATLYTNGVQLGQTTGLPGIPNATRTQNSLGKAAGSSAWFSGDIAEVLVYNTYVTPEQRKLIEGYLYSRYGIKVNTPDISPATGMYAAQQQTVTITADPGATTFFTTDGTTPTTSSPSYSAPFSITSSSVVQAFSQQAFSGGTQTSAIVKNTIGLDPQTMAVPRSGQLLWFRSDVGVKTSSGDVTNWTNLVSGFEATPVATKKPEFIASAINGLPALRFSNVTVPPSALSLQLPSMDMTEGLSLFLVMNNASGSSGRLFDTSVSAHLDLSNATGKDVGTFTATGAMSTAPIIIGQNWVLGAIVPKTSAVTSSMYVNQKLSGTGSSRITAVSSSGNLLGDVSTGNLAEVIAYGRPLSDGDRSAVESYLARRYAILQTPTLSFSVPTNTTFDKPSQVTISATPQATIYYSTTGAATTSSPVYVGPITVSYSQTIYALAVVNGVEATASAQYTLDATKWPAPSGSDAATPKINLQVPTPAQ